MRTSLIVFGVIFLVIGGLLYFVPMQKISANTSTTAANGNVDNCKIVRERTERHNTRKDRDSN